MEINPIDVRIRGCMLGESQDDDLKRKSSQHREQVEPWASTGPHGKEEGRLCNGDEHCRTNALRESEAICTLSVIIAVVTAYASA